MSHWRPTAALGRALFVAAVSAGLAIGLGAPVLLVVVAPLVVHAALALSARPTREPSVQAALDHTSLREGQGTTSRLRIEGAEDAEQITRVASRAPYVATHPTDGRVSRLLAAGEPDLEISPRRWGRRTLGEERVALTTRWAGYRWGPAPLAGSQMLVLPTTPVYGSRAENPQPTGLVGAHRGARTGSGSEFAGIREFQPGDRLRRINWRVSTRTRALHATTTRAEQDAGVLLVVDALADHASSGGLDGAASSLDLTVRAAAAVAEHAVRQGDRVAVRVVGGNGRQVPYGGGQAHLRRLLGTLATVDPGERPRHTARYTLGLTEGTTVIVLSPMLTESIATVTAATARRGLPTLVVDTLPPDAAPAAPEGADPRLADLAWRMRKVEREQVLASLAAIGCPVVGWRGPGTIDDVLRQLSRRARLPRLVGR